MTKRSEETHSFKEDDNYSKQLFLESILHSITENKNYIINTAVEFISRTVNTGKLPSTY